MRQVEYVHKTGPNLLNDIKITIFSDRSQVVAQQINCTQQNFQC